MERVCMRAVGDVKPLSLFTWNIDTLEEIRLVEADTITRTADFDTVIMSAEEQDDDSLYHFRIRQLLGSLEYADKKYSIDSAPDLLEGCPISVYDDTGLLTIGRVASDGVEVVFESVGEYDGDSAMLEYTLVSAQPVLFVPVVPSKQVQVQNLSSNGHRVDIIFAKRSSS